MFTGIIQSRGTILELAPNQLVVAAPAIAEELGASVAVDGCCLTVTASTSLEPTPPWPGAEPAPTTRIAFDILPETIERTRLTSLAVGDSVNLEAAVRAGEPLGGHLVQGHVDAVGTVTASTADPDGRWLDLTIDVPASISRFCIDRGSITVNGTSLTVMGVGEQTVRLQLIPETQARTNLGSLPVGALVNLEADVIARYVERLMRSDG